MCIYKSEKLTIIYANVSCQPKICDIMVNTSIGTPVDRLAAVNALLLTQGEGTCLDYTYKKMIGDMNNISWTSDGALGGSKPIIRDIVFANFFL